MTEHKRRPIGPSGDSVAYRVANAPKLGLASAPVELSKVFLLGLCLLLPVRAQEANNDQNGRDERLLWAGKHVGTWLEVRSLLAIVPQEPWAVEYIRDYHRWDFYPDGTLELATAYKIATSMRKFRWRTYVKEGNSFLELSDDKGIYLLARYEIKDDDQVWIAFDPHPKRVRTHPPKTFDVFQEPSIMVVVLERKKPKAKPQ
jgi:hypothetical protein